MAQNATAGRIDMPVSEYDALVARAQNAERQRDEITLQRDNERNMRLEVEKQLAAANARVQELRSVIASNQQRNDNNPLHWILAGLMLLLLAAILGGCGGSLIGPQAQQSQQAATAPTQPAGPPEVTEAVLFDRLMGEKNRLYDTMVDERNYLRGELDEARNGTSSNASQADTNRHDEIKALIDAINRATAMTITLVLDNSNDSLVGDGTSHRFESMQRQLDSIWAALDSLRAIDLADTTPEMIPNSTHITPYGQIIDTGSIRIAYNSPYSVHDLITGQPINHAGEYQVRQINVNGCTGYVESLGVIDLSVSPLVDAQPTINTRPCGS